MTTLEILVPGMLADGTAYLDIETRKVDCGATLSDGWILKRRWSAFATGVVASGLVHINASYDEPAVLQATSEAIGRRVVAYAATREFDEMILKGMFTNARRAHEREPFYPAMPGASRLTWRNMRKEFEAKRHEWNRSHDISGKEVPAAWCTNLRDLVLVHLLRDVLELVLADGKCDAVTRAWIRQILFSNSFALETLDRAVS